MSKTDQPAGPTPPAARVIAVVGAPSAEILRLFSGLAVAWRAAGLRLAGVLEHAETSPHSPRSLRVLRDLATGASYRVSQDLGAGSSSCGIYPAGYAAACTAVEAALRQGCDIAIIAKFGKLEIERGGLLSAFQTAVAVGVPVVTSVPDYAMAAWTEFTGGAEPLTVFVPADSEVIESWRCTVAREGARVRVPV